MAPSDIPVRRWQIPVLDNGQSLCREANTEKFLFYLQNQDIINGVRFCATLDYTTCLLCAALDGYVWRLPDEAENIACPPLCDHCRCVLTPVTEMDEINSSMRPAAAADFWLDAEARYARKFPKKDWNRLAYSTRLKYYYAEQRAFEEETGRPAFDQVPQNTTFSAWLHEKPVAVQDRYLGKLRGGLFRRHRLDLIDFVDRSAWTLIPQKTLLERYMP